MQSISETQQIEYRNVKFTFPAVRRHLFKDKLYHVHVLSTCVTIGEQFNDPSPKYFLELSLKNVIYWKIDHQSEKCFGIMYKKCVKYFEAQHEDLVKFRQFVQCRISFSLLQDHYRIDEMIGKGAFSSVHKVFRLNDNKCFAMKCVSSKQKNDKENMQLLINEITILNSIQCEEVLRIHEVYKIDEFHYSIITEYIDGCSLAQLIDQMKKQQHFRLKEAEVKQIMFKLLKGIQFLHSLNIIHRDIKPQNVMLINSEYDKLKIIDFGLSIQNSIQYNRCGTPGYMAPEVVNMKKEHPKKWESICDLFSAGVVFYKLLAKGQSCFQGNHQEQVLASNKKCLIEYQLVEQYNYSQSALDLLKKMLQKEPGDRINASDALSHEFFEELMPERAMENLQVEKEQMEKSKIKIYHFQAKPSQISRK